jgi:hypothetical protein
MAKIRATHSFGQKCTRELKRTKAPNYNGQKFDTNKSKPGGFLKITKTTDAAQDEPMG